MDIETIFEKPFDYERYIEEWLLSIDDLNERTFARKYLADCLKGIMRESEKSYKQLENRVFSEIEGSSNRHSIYLTVVKRELYDITNGSWFPLLKDDKITAGKHPTGDIFAIQVACLFYTGDSDGIFRLGQMGDRQFKGSVQIGTNTYHATFRITSATQYLQLVEQLYVLFRANGIPWTTLNCGYLLRFFNVEVLSIEGEWKTNDEITGYSVSFGELDENLQAGYMPVWNIQELFYDSSQFVLPCIDTKYYEHSFPKDKFGAEDGYLLKGNKDILSFRQTGNEIKIITTEETFQKWIAYRIVYKPALELHCFQNLILHNVSKDSFASRFLNGSGILLQSRMEIIRRVEQFDLAEHIKLQDVTLITDTVERYDNTNLSVMNVSPLKNSDITYIRHHNLNWFIAEDFVNTEEEKVLLFEFKMLKNSFLCYDLICFVISEMQRNFNEYRCEAVLTDKENVG